jgi:hypothetical protein
MADHEPQPIGEDVIGALGITMCSVCHEKLRRTADGWEHFGGDVPYETYDLRREGDD